MSKKTVPSEQEIARKHGVSVKYVIRQAEVGSTVEREHVTTHEEAYGIALQHIDEFPDYYKHLLKMEKKLKSEWKNGKKSVKEQKEEVRYCHLCEKEETKSECSYGPNAWEMATRKSNVDEGLIRRLIDKAKGRKEVGRTGSGGRIYQSTRKNPSKIVYGGNKPKVNKLTTAKKSNNNDDPWLQGARSSGGAELKAHYRQLRGESKTFSQFMSEASNFNHPIDPNHRTFQRQAKIRNLADKTSNPGEASAAKSKLKGPEWKKPKLTEASPAWTRKEGQSPTGGLNAAGRASAKAQGHNLKPPVTTPPSKLDPNSEAAKRRGSFCARMSANPGPMKDEKGRPTRKALALKKWNCN